MWLKNQGVCIVTDHDAATTPFIAGLTVDGAAHPSSWLPLKEIRNGADLAYALQSRPSSWAAADALTPPSGARADYTKPVASGSTGG